MKEVPLVVYIDGVRNVIGTAEVDDSGAMSAKINEEGAKCLNIGLDAGEFSIGWTPSSPEELEPIAPLSAGLAPTTSVTKLDRSFFVNAVEIGTDDRGQDD